MTDISSRLADYPDLLPRQRAEVDAFVAAHPEWEGSLAEAQAFAALLDAAVDDETDAVVRRAVDERLGLNTSEREWAPRSGDTLDADRLRRRLDELATAEDPVRKFERLTGRSLDAASVAEPALGGDGQAHGLSAAPDRPAVVALRRSSHLPRWIAVGVAVLAVAYGGLYAASAASVSERSQLAALGELSGYVAPTLRGTADASLPGRLDAALDRVDEARQSTLGLFPRYDADRLAAVAADLGAVATEADPETAVSQEARYALGRVSLYLGRDADAARVLGTLVREGGYRAPAARRLLDYIRTQDGA